jgi:hypothetical protein
MTKITNAINAVYNFIVGDMIILVGIVLALIILIIINAIPALGVVRPFIGTLFIIFTIAALVATLAREAYSRER